MSAVDRWSFVQSHPTADVTCSPDKEMREVGPFVAAAEPKGVESSVKQHNADMVSELTPSTYGST